MHIELSGVSHRIPGQAKPLFFIPFLEIPSGGRLLIHGPSGRGKTTLLHLLSGQFPPDSGQVRVEGRDLGAMGAAERADFRREHFGIVFQRGNLIDHLSVLENVEVGLPPGLRNPRERALEALSRVDLGSLAARRAGLLSPGEQQRAAVARVWAASPAVILADEPTSSLDAPGSETVMDALWEAARDRTLVVVSHDPRIRSRFETVRDFADFAEPA